MHGIFDVACIGTSLTDSWSANNWPLEARDRLQAGKQERVRFHAVALQGMNSAWGLENIRGVTDKRPRVALIEFAINDCIADDPAHAVPWLTLQQSYDNHMAMIAAIRAARSDALIWLMTMNPCVDAGGARARRPLLATYYAQYTAIAQAAGVGLIDNYTTWLARGEPQLVADMPDGSHPIIEAQRAVLIPNVVTALAPYVR